jgi:hypothetical protein
MKMTDTSRDDADSLFEVCQDVPSKERFQYFKWFSLLVVSLFVVYSICASRLLSDQPTRKLKLYLSNCPRPVTVETKPPTVHSCLSGSRKCTETGYVLNKDPNETNFPKIIHFSLKNKTHLNEMQQKVIEKWRKLNPGYEVRLNDDEDQLKFVEEYFPEYLRIYQSFERNIERSDFWRYLAVLKDGGVYADTDVYPFLPVDQWHLPFVNGDMELNPVRSLVGLEMMPSDESEWESQFCQSTFAAIPGEPWLYRVLEKITEIASYECHSGESVGDPIQRTGPIPWSEAIREYMDQIGMPQEPIWRNQNLLVKGFGALKKQAFRPNRPLDKDVYVEHMFAGSWKKWWKMDEPLYEQGNPYSF